MRVANRHEGATGYTSNTRTCEALNCRLGTRESKPFCPEHVEMNEHALWVTRQIAAREIEDAGVLRGAPLASYNIKGLTARSILQQLAEHGTRTKRRLCRELSLERKVLDGYVKALLTKELVVEGRTQRGSETLSLP